MTLAQIQARTSVNMQQAFGLNIQRSEEHMEGTETSINSSANAENNRERNLENSEEGLNDET